MYPALKKHIYALDFSLISDARKQDIEAIRRYAQQVLDRGELLQLNFICTHNSRRSQFAQVWGQTAAYYFGIRAICYSGGVEVTAFNERAIASLQRMGFEISRQGTENPHYAVSFSTAAPSIPCFSKVYDDSVNPQAGFAAVMTCSHAEEHCPFIAGAACRLPLRYEDPKLFDDTPLELEKYDARSVEIATDLFYLFSLLR